jgi:putative lipoprotein (rSAM/lipoprotein system)
MYGVIPTPYRPLATDTSEVDGTYRVSQRISAGELQNNMLPVYVEDIDGDENGLYRDTTIVVDFENAVRSGKKKGWYDGERTVELKVELQPKLKHDE